jgi:hypothetical protein
MSQQQKLPSNKRIARQKKAQAGFSLVGGTLGLAALASRGKASQVTRRAAKAESKADPYLAGVHHEEATRWKDRSTALTTAGAGVGGVGAYNFASYTNADAKKQQRLKKNMDPFEIHKRRDNDSLNEVEGAVIGGATGTALTARRGVREARRLVDRSQRYNRLNDSDKVINPIKGVTRNQTKIQMARRGAKGFGRKVGPAAAAGAAFGAGYGHLLQRAERKNEVKKNSDPFEINKLGGPKVRFQEITSYSQGKNTTTRHDADTVTTRYKGKSLILRRPKYQAVAHPSDAALKRSSYATATPNGRASKDAAKAIAAAHEKKSKTIKLGPHKVKHEMAKSATSAFGIDHSY